MLTSPPQLLPEIVRPVEGDAKSSPSTLSIPHDMDLKPQIPPHSSSRYHLLCSLHNAQCVNLHYFGLHPSPSLVQVFLESKV